MMEGVEDSNHGDPSIPKKEEMEEVNDKNVQNGVNESSEKKEKEAKNTAEEGEKEESTCLPLVDLDPKTCEIRQPHRFAPKDLLTVLRNVERDIAACEAVVKDEAEKRKRHRIDDCR